MWMVDYVLDVKMAMVAKEETTNMKAMKAYRQRFAHFVSALLNNSINSCLSSSVLRGSQPSGGLNGEMRMMIPANQNKGNTIKSKHESRTIRIRRRDYSQNPNLKRYMASEGGSTTASYDGRSDASVYGGGGTSS